MIHTLRILLFISCMSSTYGSDNLKHQKFQASEIEPVSKQNDKIPDDSSNLNKSYAHLQYVDKLTGRFKSIYAKVGKNTSYEDLKINVKICRSSPVFESPESKAYIKIWDKTHKKNIELFKGWMISSSPALSTLINHPRYNVWLIKCVNKKSTINGN